jgi:hypothetical protein
MEAEQRCPKLHDGGKSYHPTRCLLRCRALRRHLIKKHSNPYLRALPPSSLLALRAHTYTFAPHPRCGLLLQDTNMPKEARVKVREYFQKSKKLFKRRSYAELIDLCLSDEMQGDVRYLISFEVFDGVWWLKELDRQFLEDLSIRLRRVAFAPKEIISGDQLNILTHGMATRDGAFKSPGMWWGDVFITSSRLRDTTPATCLLYCEVARLTRHDLLEVRATADLFLLLLLMDLLRTPRAYGTPLVPRCTSS